MSIFGKPRQQQPAPVNSPTISEPTSAQNSSSVTVVSRGTVLNGEISSNDKIQIDGHIEGNLSVKNAVIVGNTGRITADITATSLQIYGKVIGDVVASDRVCIERSGSVEGNIRSPKLMISEGAHFRGNIDMSQQKIPAEKVEPGAPEDRKEKKLDLRKGLEK